MPLYLPTSPPKRLFKAKRHTRLVRPLASEWCRAKPFQKLAAAYWTLHEMGGVLFTLRMHLDAVIAVECSADPVRTMARRVQRAFKRAGLQLPHFAFSFEVTSDDRNELHLHGAILLEGLDIERVKMALRVSAGKITGMAAARQLQFTGFDLNRGGPSGWAGYVQPTATRTRSTIEHHRITYISSALSRICALEWKNRRVQLAAERV